MADHYNVIVVGAGNAALCAALAARDKGATVLVLEKAPEYFRGGNSYFTGGAIRCAYEGLEDIKALIPDMSSEEECSIDVGSYTQSDFYDDLMRVTEGMSDPELAQVLVSQSHPTLVWQRKLGLRFVLLYGRQSFKVDGKHRFWGGLTVEAVGGGKGLSDQQFDLAVSTGVEVQYGTKAIKLLQDQNARVIGLVKQGPDGRQKVFSDSVVLACGGFEANAEMRTRYLGPGWELAKVRGVPYNTGDGIRMALDVGAQSHGHWSGCHAVAWDLNAPPYGDRTVTDLFQKHSYPFGVIVNVYGKRFVDEGADMRNYTYAKYGREILYQPQRTAFQIFDDKVKHLLRDEYRIPQCTMVESGSIEGLADGLDIDQGQLLKTIKEYNLSVQPGDFNPTVLDGKCTSGVEPPKSNWAQKIDTPPYLGYAVTCGITFTFGGLRINARTQVIDTEGLPIPGLYAAGELIGGLFYHNYPGGSGLIAGSVFGRIAGTNATKDTMTR
ncbi:FAD-binding dehydrogenase [SAR202 cluster bacterium AD-804-J14_MRT_500m]|nr:FAD-binding dehydrogenase [SAR202 cluster bacterium AD-804-J14_MRT_500m]